MIALIRRLFGRATPALLDAGPRDAVAIAALHAAAFHRGWSEDEVERLIVDGAVMTHRAMLSGKLAGFIMSRRAADEAEILSVAVSHACRGRGIGRELLQLHLRRLAGDGVRTVFLEVDETNTPAIRLYRRAGFREVGRRPNYYATPGAKPAAALVLRRDLG
jgi:[ribosomal protein S18]-alanine N-acetyltransferase